MLFFISGPKQSTFRINVMTKKGHQDFWEEKVLA